MAIQGESAAALRALARGNGCTVSMLLLAAANALLHRYSGEEDLIINTIFSARNRPELSGLVGLLMNTIPVRTDLAGRPSFRTLLHRVRDAVLAGYSRQEVPFPRVLAELFPGRPFSRTLLSGINFNFLQFEEAGAGPNPPPLPGGLRASLFPAADEIAKQDLLFNCRDTGDALRCQLVGAADLFHPEGMAALAEELEALLKRAAENPDEPLDRLLPLREALPEPSKLRQT
jgi:non-ribosomal peptide synthetase component F